MPIALNDIPQTFFTRVNNAAKSGDFSLILDLFLPQAVMEWTLKLPLKFTTSELIVDALQDLSKGFTLVVSPPASTENIVAVNFYMYAAGSQTPASSGTATFTVNEKSKITYLKVVPLAQ